jgi:hypothetical protein
MLSTANNTHMLMYGGTIAAARVWFRPQAELAQRTIDAASGV